MIQNLNETRNSAKYEAVIEIEHMEMLNKYTQIPQCIFLLN